MLAVKHEPAVCLFGQVKNYELQRKKVLIPGAPLPAEIAHRRRLREAKARVKAAKLDQERMGLDEDEDEDQGARGAVAERRRARALERAAAAREEREEEEQLEWTSALVPGDALSEVLLVPAAVPVAFRLRAIGADGSVTHFSEDMVVRAGLPGKRQDNLLPRHAETFILF